MIEFLFSPTHLPVVFAVLMGVAILLYVILDGYDLGIGMLILAAPEAERDRMVAAIGPFWDANETWLVLAVGLLLVAFPMAHGIILTALYLPVAAMLVGLILRGVAFEFRAKAHGVEKAWWTVAFAGGSLLAALSQGWMLGLYVLGLPSGWAPLAFAALVAVCLAAAYTLIGATWLIVKTEGSLQTRAVGWAKRMLVFALVGMAAVSLATPLVSPRLFAKWFDWPTVLWLAPIPLAATVAFGLLWRSLQGLPRANDRGSLTPFLLTAGIFTLGFAGMAYSFFPYVVPERLTLWQAASAPEALAIILVGTLVVLPMILGYTALSYRIFRGKARDLTYG
ncbi:MAG: cytochrome d ubiquinol oxidase subunit II [Alphaproteobacteria bacterium]|nr:cytochrome d ubiquinol oxidase subunit II [Alphaproteobacteria bacterium]TAD91043.1 MAG: cytochrome d ubiquinol oxidase subunit II [Alphaproteobacteria bacterium]